MGILPHHCLWPPLLHSKCIVVTAIALPALLLRSFNDDGDIKLFLCSNLVEKGDLCHKKGGAASFLAVFLFILPFYLPHYGRMKKLFEGAQLLSVQKNFFRYSLMA